jgi:hypothetical protein
MPISTSVYLSAILVKRYLKGALIWIFIERKRCK